MESGRVVPVAAAPGALTVAAAPGAPHSRCNGQVKAPRCLSQSLQPPQVPLTVAAGPRSKPPGAPHSRCSSQVPLTVAAAPRVPLTVAAAFQVPLTVGPVFLPVQLGPLSCRSCSACCRTSPVGSVVVTVLLGPLSYRFLLGPLLYRSCSAKMFCPNVLPKCSA